MIISGFLCLVVVCRAGFHFIINQLDDVDISV